LFHHHQELHQRAAELGLTPALLKNEGWENMNKHHRRFIYRHSPHGGQPGRKRKPQLVFGAEAKQQPQLIAKRTKAIATEPGKQRNECNSPLLKLQLMLTNR
jgi:hypothetical protein